MAEKKKTTKKKNPRFGGKRDLKDMDKSGGISFGDTFLGDLLGFDKDGIGLQGRAGLLKSLKGARRKKPGTATTTTKKKKKTVPFKEAARDTKTAPRKRPTEKRRTPFKEPSRERTRTDRTRPSERVGDLPRRPTGPGPDRGPRPNPNARPSKPLPEKVFTPAEQKKNLKKITLENFKKLTPKERKMMGLPKTQAEAARLLGRPIGTPIYTGGFKNSANMNKGGMARKKPVAKMNKGGMAKKSGYMYGGSVTKKKPINKGGMARKK